MLDGVDDYQSVTGADVDEDHPHGDLDRIELDDCPIMTNRGNVTALYGADIVFLYECLHVRRALIDNYYYTSDSTTLRPRLTDYHYEFTRNLSLSQLVGLLEMFYRLDCRRFLHMDTTISIYKDFRESGYTDIDSMLLSEGLSRSSEHDLPYPLPNPYESPGVSNLLKYEPILDMLRNIDALSIVWVRFFHMERYPETIYYPSSKRMDYTGSADSSWGTWPTDEKECFYFHQSFMEGSPETYPEMRYVGDATMWVPTTLGGISCMFPGKNLCQRIRPLVRLTVEHTTGQVDPPSFVKIAYVTLPFVTGGPANTLYLDYGSLVSAAGKAVRDLGIDDRADAEQTSYYSGRVSVSTKVTLSGLAAVCIIAPKYSEIS